MKVRQPDWLYTSHGPYLVTRHWQDGRSETCPADTLESALHRALHWHSIGPDQTVAVVDGWGEFVFARPSHGAPTAEVSPAGTLECYQMLMDVVPHDDPSGAGVAAMFAGIDPT